MKKKIFTFVFVLGVFANAFALKYWVVTTSCGLKSPLRTIDNVSIDEMVYLVSQINQDLCGVTPGHVTINPYFFSALLKNRRGFLLQ